MTAHDQRSELPLICFTVFVPAAVGLSLLSLVAGLSHRWVLALVCVCALAVGMAASIVHLAKPLRAPTSLRGITSSWLSREIACVSVVFALACCWAALAMASAWGVVATEFEPLIVAANLATCVVGVTLLLVIARAYVVHAQPAWDGVDTYLDIVAVSCVAGAGLFVGALALDALVEGAEVASLPLTVALVLCAVGVIISRRATMGRKARLEQLTTSDPRPRVVASCKQFEALASLRARSVRCASAGAIILAIAIGVSVIAPTGEGGTYAVAALALLACVIFLASCFFARDAFYSLATTARNAVRLHRW